MAEYKTLSYAPEHGDSTNVYLRKFSFPKFEYDIDYDDCDEEEEDDSGGRCDTVTIL